MDDPSHQPLVRIMALHAIAYCERLFYLEEVEQIRVADDRVYAGRRLHESLDKDGEWTELTIESETLGIMGKVDALRKRNGELIPYEHKRGRACRIDGEPTSWESDWLQLGAYALLLEEALEIDIPEGRIRYHADNATVRVPIDERLRVAVHEKVARARVLRETSVRPPITENERLCLHCSLAPVCLPEETRTSELAGHRPRRLFPETDDRQPLHILGYGTRVGRKGYELSIKPRDVDAKESREPIRRIRSVNLHGYSTISAQALDLCASQNVGVHWFGPGGRYIGSFQRDDDSVQRRIRQYEALRDESRCFALAKLLVAAKTEQQLRFVLRSSRGQDRSQLKIEEPIEQMRTAISSISRASSASELLGAEGWTAKLYFSILPALLRDKVDPAFQPSGRSRRPPRDPFNALLSFGYGLLLREVQQAIRSVGLDGAFGFYHRPRSSAPPLALDVIELFRVVCVDMPVVAAINRGHFDADQHFDRGGEKVWLSKVGRKKAISLFEQRLADTWKHPVLDYSLSYRRAIELEVRLLEKEWCGEAGLFARMRLR